VIFVVKTKIETSENEVVSKNLTGFCTNHETSFDRQIYSIVRDLRDLVADERFIVLHHMQATSTKH